MNILKKLEFEKSQRVFFVGDLHGEYDALMNKLRSIQFDFNKDILISVGDLVDRGPRIREILDLFINKPNFYAVIGNHDNFLLNYDTQPDKWFGDIRNNSEQTINQLGFKNLKKYKKLLNKHLSLFLEIKQGDQIFGVVHGGIPFDSNKPQSWNKIIRKARRNKYYRANLLWDRTTLRYYLKNGLEGIPCVSGVDFLIHGHTTLETPLNFQNRYFIDTFSKSGNLTLLHYNFTCNQFEFL